MEGDARMDSAGPLVPVGDVFRDRWDDSFIISAADCRGYSYGEFCHMVKAAASFLGDEGIGRGDKLCVSMENSVSLAAVYFASLALGLNVIPVDPRKGRREMEDILSRTMHRFAICSQPDLPHTERAICAAEFSRMLSDCGCGTRDDAGIFDKVDGGALFLTSFTSGSTGLPKGVMHSFDNLAGSAMAFARIFGFSPSNVFYHNFPMSYMAGILNLLIMPFICGSSIVVGERFSVSGVSGFWTYPIRFGVNTFWFNPTMLSLLMRLDRGGDGIGHCRGNKITACVGTAPLDYSLKNAFEGKYGIVLHESYGLSETLFVSSNGPGVPYEKGGVGAVLDGVKISFGPDSEIKIDAPWNFLGYSNMDSSSFSDNGGFLSGDLGELDGRGLLFIRGRKKDLIIKGGLNISPRRIEEFVGELGFFGESVVLGLKDEILGEKIACFFSPSDKYQGLKTQKEINNAIVRELGRDSAIDQFVALDHLPKNVNGKTDKMRLREEYSAS